MMSPANDRRICIYCRRDLPVSAFNREHILLQALGRFNGEPTTIHSVCRECNQYFGDSIDLLFARGSVEALLRIELGLKPAEAVTHLRFDRLAFQYPVGSYKGLWLEPTHDQGRVLLRPLPQAGFTALGGASWLYVTLRDLRRLTRPPEGIDLTAMKRAIAMTQADYDEVMAQLHRLGVGFTREPLPTPEGWGEVSTDVTAEVDEAVRRAAAKMGFNYLASIMGPEFMLDGDFDTIRRFIRYGDISGQRLVTESQTPILRDDTILRRQTRGHLIVVEQDSRTGELVCLFSPFNEITYRIVLRSSSVIFQTGHHYDLETRTVSPLFASSILPLR